MHLVCPKRIQTIVERQIHSFYPDAEISVGVPPKIFDKQFPAIKGAVFELAKNYVLPIRTYRYMDADPLSALTTTMTKLKDEATAAIQIIVQPVSESWRTQTLIASQDVAAGKLHSVNSTGTKRVLMTLANAGKPSPNQDPKNPQTPKPVNEETLKALQEKGAKAGFRTVIRVVATGKNDLSAEENLKAIISSFSQFYAPQFNSMKYRLVKSNVVAKEYLLRLIGRAPKMLLNTEELASIIHIPNKNIETPGVKWVYSRTLPPPPDLPEKGTVIGQTDFRGVNKLIRIQDPDRMRHIFMLGKTGVGKTTLFELMIEQDMHEGKGLCFIDPNGDAVEDILKKVPTERAKDVILFDPSDTLHPMGLNLLQWRSKEEKDFLIQEVIEIFYKLFDPNRTGIVGPQWEHWARNAALTVMNLPEGGSLIDIPRLFTDSAFQKYAVSQVTDPVVKAFWQEQLAKTADFHKSEMYNYFISKFGRFMTNDLMRNIIGQKKSSLDFRAAMDEGKILLVNLAKGKIGEINAKLLGLILVSKIQVAAFSRADVDEDARKPFYLYVDEFQNFTTDSFATILSEARKFGLSLNITNQYIAQLTEQIRDAVIGNAGTLISYRIGAEDSEFLAKEMPGVTAEDLTNLDRFKAYVKLLVNLAPVKPFSLSGIKSPNEGSKDMATWIKKNCQVKYSMKPVEYKSYNVSMPEEVNK